MLSRDAGAHRSTVRDFIGAVQHCEAVQVQPAGRAQPFDLSGDEVRLAAVIKRR